MAVYLPKGGKTFRYDFSVKGVKYRGSTGCTNRQAAAKFEADLKAEKKRVARRAQDLLQARVTLGIADAAGLTVIPTFLEAVDAYCAGPGANVTNKDDDERALNWLCDVIGEGTLVTDIRNKTVERVVTLRAAMPKLSQPRRDRKTGEIIPGKRQVVDFETQKLRPFDPTTDDPKRIVTIASATVNRSSIDVLKRVLLYARDTLEVPGMPPIKWKAYRLREPKGRARTMSHVEEALIEEHLREGYGAAFQFAVRAGFRLSNFAGEFTWDQVDFANRRIRIVQKGGVQHISHMTPEMEEILQAQVGRHQRHVFMFRYEGRGRNPKPWVNPRNGRTYFPGELYPVTYWGFDSWFDDVREATGLHDLTIHDLRRTAASRVVREIGNPKAAQKLLGHASMAMILSVYNQLADDEAFEDLSEAERRIADRRKRERAA
jgi:integrase